MRKESDMKAERAMLPAQTDTGTPATRNGEGKPPAFAAFPHAREAPITSITDGADRENKGPKRTIFAIARNQDRVRFIGSDERHVDKAAAAHVVPFLRRGVPVLEIDLTGRRKQYDATTAQLDEEYIPWQEEIANPQKMMQEHKTPTDAAEVFVSTMDTKEQKEAVRLTAEATFLFGVLMDDTDLERPGDPRDRMRPGAPASVGKLYEALAFLTGAHSADRLKLRGDLEPQLQMLREPNNAADIFTDSLVKQAATEGKSLYTADVESYRAHAEKIFGFLTDSTDPDRPPDPTLDDPFAENRRTREKPSIEKLHDAIAGILGTPTADERNLRFVRDPEAPPITFTQFQEEMIAELAGAELEEENVTALTALQEHAAQLILRGHKEDIQLTKKQAKELQRYGERKINESKGEIWEEMRMHAAELIRGHTGQESKRHNVPPDAPADFPIPLTRRIVRPGVSEAGLQLQRNLILMHEIAQLHAGRHPLIIKVNGSNLADPKQWETLAALCRSNGIGLFDTIVSPDEEDVKKLDGTLVFTRIEDANVARRIAESSVETPDTKTSTSVSGDQLTVSREGSAEKKLEQRHIQLIPPDRAVVVTPDGVVHHNIRLFTLPGDIDYGDSDIIVTGPTLWTERLMIHADLMRDDVMHATRTITRGGTRLVQQVVARPVRAAIDRLPRPAIGNGGGGEDQTAAIPAANEPAALEPGPTAASDEELMLDSLGQDEPVIPAPLSIGGERPFVIQAEEIPLPEEGGTVPVDDPLFLRMTQEHPPQDQGRRRRLADFIGGQGRDDGNGGTDRGRRGRRRLLAFVEGRGNAGPTESAEVRKAKKAILNDADAISALIDTAQNNFRLDTFWPLRNRLIGPEELEQPDMQLLAVYKRDDESYALLRKHLRMWQYAPGGDDKPDFGQYMEAQKAVLDRLMKRSAKGLTEDQQREMEELATVVAIWQGENKPHAVINTVMEEAIKNTLENSGGRTVDSIPDEVPDDENERFAYFTQHLAPLAELDLNQFKEQFTPEIKAQLIYYIDKEIKLFLAEKADEEAVYDGTMAGVGRILGPNSLRMAQLIMASQDPTVVATYDREKLLAMNFRNFANEYLGYEVSEGYNQRFVGSD